MSARSIPAKKWVLVVLDVADVHSQRLEKVDEDNTLAHVALSALARRNAKIPPNLVLQVSNSGAGYQELPSETKVGEVLAGGADSILYVSSPASSPAATSAFGQSELGVMDVLHEAQDTIQESASYLSTNATKAMTALQSALEEDEDPVLTRQNQYDLFFGLVITLNAVVIGIESDISVRREGEAEFDSVGTW